MVVCFLFLIPLLRLGVVVGGCGLNHASSTLGSPEGQHSSQLHFVGVIVFLTSTDWYLMLPMWLGFESWLSSGGRDEFISPSHLEMRDTDKSAPSILGISHHHSFLMLGPHILCWHLTKLWLQYRLVFHSNPYMPSIVFCACLFQEACTVLKIY